MVCEYGRCREICEQDLDCSDDSACVASLDIAERVCMLDFENRCGEGGVCPERLYCGPDDLCHEGCGDPNSCEGERECYGIEYNTADEQWECPGRDCVCIER